MPLVDFHTHSKASSNSAKLSIECLNLDQPIHIEKRGYYTIGIHPWQTKVSNLNEYFYTIHNILQNPQVIGLGEVGLDKLRGADIETQKKILKKQVSLGYEISKPIIIHCVKAWNDLIETKKSFSTSFPWAIHGFNGSIELANQLLDIGFYLSVGSLLLDSNSKISSTINQIPLNRLFLETDDSDSTIEEIYDAASKRLGISVSKLEIQIYNNFLTFFKV